MQNKIKKLISQTPAENLKPFLDSYNLDLPQDFNWQNDSRKYHSQLFNSIWNAHEDHKSTLFELIERIHEMVDELGQAALHAEVGSNDTFLSLKSEHARCLWVLQHHPDKFHKAEYCASLDYKRKSREWSTFVAPKGREVHDSKEHLEEFEQLALKHLDISKKIKVELFSRTKTDHRSNELKIFQLVAYHDGLHKSVQTFEKEDVVTKFLSSVNEFSISYEPESGIIEVTSNYKDNRAQLAKTFANVFLKTEEDVDEIKIKRFDLSKLKMPYDFMKDVDATDLIDEVKVTMIKLAIRGDKGSTVLSAPFTHQSTIYEYAAKYLSTSNPLHNPIFEVKKVKLSIKFKSTDKKPRGELLHVTITNPNGCDLKDRSERQKMIGNKYLERWELMERI